MRNLFTIFRRELSTYFNSSIGYIFIIVLLLVNTALFINMTQFFAFPRADMGRMFEFFALILCVFIPLVSMRLWAEDRKENTIEMLLTLPMQPHHLVLGKYFASLFFYLVALAGTFPIPLMLGVLGEPDWGVVATSYLGAFLLGALFLAIGIFFSGLVKDQIAAALLTLAACFTIYLSGLDFITAHLNTFIGGLGDFLQQALAVSTHYQTFTKGVIELSSLLYFAIWITLFLFLNGFFFEARNRRGYREAFAAVFVLCLGIGMMANFILGGFSLKRFDLTEGQIYSVSPVTGEILAELQAPVNVNLYISPPEQMPGRFKDVSVEIENKLEEMEVVSGGKLRHKKVYLSTANYSRAQQKQALEMMKAQFGGELAPELEERLREREDTIEEDLMERGIKPISATMVAEDRLTSQRFYLAIGVAYKDKQEQFIDFQDEQTRNLSEAISNKLRNLEYEVVQRVYQVSREKKTLAVVTPKVPSKMQAFYRQQGRDPNDFDDVIELLSEGYEVKHVALSKEEPLPEEFDTLIIIFPQKFSDRQKWEVARALHNGKNVFLAVHDYIYNYQPTRDSVMVAKDARQPQVNDWLKNYGVEVSDKILLDPNSVPLSFGRSFPVDSPTHILLYRANMQQDTLITSRLDQVLYVWGSALKLDKNTLEENKLNHELIMQTSPDAWTLPKDTNLSLQDLEAPEQTQQYPAMVLLEGQFPIVYQGEDVPEWSNNSDFPTPPSPEEKEENNQEEQKAASLPPADPQPAKLLVFGNAFIFRDGILQGDRADLLRNSVDYLTLGEKAEKIAHIRSKDIPLRMINRLEEGQILFWKLLNYLLVPCLLIIFGVSRLGIKKFQREQYTLKMQKAS